MKDTLKDLNDHLFEEMERLNDEDLSGEELDKEIKRADAMTKVSKQIISNGSLAVRAANLQYEMGMKVNMPTFIEEKKK